MSVEIRLKERGDCGWCHGVGKKGDKLCHSCYGSGDYITTFGDELLEFIDTYLPHYQAWKKERSGFFTV